MKDWQKLLMWIILLVGMWATWEIIDQRNEKTITYQKEFMQKLNESLEIYDDNIVMLKKEVHQLRFDLMISGKKIPKRTYLKEDKRVK
jgi:hypothetical protein